MPVTPAAPNLLHLSTPDSDTAEMLYPWEQSAILRARLDDHVCDCVYCTMRTLAIFGADMTRTTFAAGCDDGAKLYADLRAIAVTRRSKLGNNA